MGHEFAPAAGAAKQWEEDGSRIGALGRKGKSSEGLEGERFLHPFQGAISTEANGNQGLRICAVIDHLVLVHVLSRRDRLLPGYSDGRSNGIVLSNVRSFLSEGTRLISSFGASPGCFMRSKASYRVPVTVYDRYFIVSRSTWTT